MKLVWGAVGTRYYEAGVDKAVLYPPGIDGVSWNGLKAVKESPTGGDPEPYYYDGFKYANVALAEEFAATIEALSSPDEFGECDGTAKIHNGLFVTQQPRKSFGLCYRTGLGNDTVDLSRGYKLHLVYNALAAPSDRDNTTLTNQSNPLPLSWDISTSPEFMTGFKPSAHLVIDSTKTDPLILGYLESLLYGATGMNPELPSANEVLSLFEWAASGITYPINVLGIAPGTVDTATNMCTNPSMETASGTVAVRQNLATDPRATTLNLGSGVIAPRSSRFFGTGATGTYTLITGAVDGPFGITTYVRKTWTTNNTTTNGNTGVQWTGGGTGAFPVTPGDVLAVSGCLRPSVASKGGASAKMYWYDAAGVALSPQFTQGTSVALTAGQWTRLSAIVTVPATAAFASPVLDVDSGTNWLAGDILDCTGFLLEKNVNLIGSYFDGGIQAAPDSDLTASWVSTVNQSQSRLTGPVVTGYGSGSGPKMFGWQSSQWASGRSKSLRLRSIFSATDPASYYQANGLTFVVGTTYTAMAKVRLEAPLVGARRSESLRLQVRGLAGVVVADSNTPDNVAGVQTVKVTWIATASNALRLYHGGIEGSGDVWWDDLIVIEGDYSGPYFDGASPNMVVYSQMLDPAWNGTADASTSKMDYLRSLKNPGTLGDAYIISGNMWVYSSDGYWKNYGPPPS